MSKFKKIVVAIVLTLTVSGGSASTTTVYNQGSTNDSVHGMGAYASYYSNEGNHSARVVRKSDGKSNTSNKSSGVTAYAWVDTKWAEVAYFYHFNY